MVDELAMGKGLRSTCTEGSLPGSFSGSSARLSPVDESARCRLVADGRRLPRRLPAPEPVLLGAACMLTCSSSQAAGGAWQAAQRNDNHCTMVGSALAWCYNGAGKRAWLRR